MRVPSDSAPTIPVVPLIVAGLVLGLVGDVVLRAPDPPGLNMLVWVAAIALAAYVLQRRTAAELDGERVAWLAMAVLFAAGLAWRDSPPLRLLALGCVTLSFALAAYRVSGAWVRRAGVTSYGLAWAMGALHAWAASVLVLLGAWQSTRRPATGRATGWRQVAAIARGLVIAAPLVVVFGALFMAADAVFSEMVLNVVRIDFERIAGHVLLFSVCAWLTAGYLRGFLTGTELTPIRDLWRSGALASLVPRWFALSITEVTTALGALNVLFLLFVVVQFRYLFGGDALVQVTPDLTYAEYARRGFFELVFAVVLVVPILLAADWLLAREQRRDEVVFRVLAGTQIALVVAIMASALQRLRLYYATYGLTDSRFYGMALLFWIAAMLLWFAATVLRGRRDAFAFGALASGLATLALLFVSNPDAIVARTNVQRLTSGDATRPFDVAYATSLSGDAVPVLIDALPSLPPDVQCRVAARLLRRWPIERERSLRSWNWAAARASDLVREQAPRLHESVGPDGRCAE